MSKAQNAPSSPGFQDFQFAFTRHIRDPKTHPRPAGVSAQRMQVYNELLYNNLESFLLACFPVLRQLLGKRKWAKLVRDFFVEHRCHTPFFRQIPDEFVQYVQSERGIRESDPPFLLELAHYEWIELVLSVSNKEIALAQIDPDGDLAQNNLALNPVLAMLQYQYPVQRIGPKFKPQSPPPQCIIATSIACGTAGWLPEVAVLIRRLRIRSGTIQNSPFLMSSASKCK